jgi:hypothetical protein
MEKIGENNWKVREISWTKSQARAFGLNMIKFEHDGL